MDRDYQTAGEQARWEAHIKMEREAQDKARRSSTLYQNQGMVQDMGQSWGNQTAGLKTSSGDAELRKFALDMASRTVYAGPGGFSPPHEVFLRAAREYEAYIKGT